MVLSVDGGVGQEASALSSGLADDEFRAVQVDASGGRPRLLATAPSSLFTRAPTIDLNSGN